MLIANPNTSVYLDSFYLLPAEDEEFLFSCIKKSVLAHTHQPHWHTTFRGILVFVAGVTGVTGMTFGKGIVQSVLLLTIRRSFIPTSTRTVCRQPGMRMRRVECSRERLENWIANAELLMLCHIIQQWQLNNCRTHSIFPVPPQIRKNCDTLVP